MKKIADFIVEKRHFIVSFILIVAIISAVLIPNVKINKDMTEYLPDNSPMREGLSILEKEFPDVKITGSIRVMFEGLSKDEIPDILNLLKNIKYVSSVNYNESEDYNKGKYTLFLVNCNYEYGTEEEQFVENSIKENFKDKNMVMQHSIATLLQIPTWVYFLIVAVLLLILFLMCSSYLEPFLFLFTIGIAIVINLGTNIIFGSVAETTFTLSAVLQLALSMDYSIILMNRYRQGKENCESTKEAMKNAYKAAFPSIISSGLTTVLGLLMLIFMRFKIGLDLGRVMAKGVAISMICVLTILPALILLFDKWIVKTQKKELHIGTKWLSKFNFKGRKVLAICFVVLFIGTALLQGITKITFAQPKDQSIESKFKSANPIVILYNNDDSGYIEKLSSGFDDNSNIKSVLSYQTTIGKPLTAEEMSEAVKSLGGNLKIDKQLINLIYYNYHNKGKELPEISLEELISYLDENIVKNEAFNTIIDPNTAELISKYKNLLSKETLTKDLTTKEMSDLTGIKEDQIELLYSVYFSGLKDYEPKSIVLSNLIYFIKNNIIDNPMFNGKIPESAKNEIISLIPFINKITIKSPVDENTMSSKYGFDEKFVKQIFDYKFTAGEERKMSVYDFVSFVIKEIAPNGTISEEEIKLFKKLKTVMDGAGLPVPYSMISSMIEMDPKIVKLIYTYYYVIDNPGNFKSSVEKIINNFDTTILPEPNGSFDKIKSIVNSVVSEEKLSVEKSFNIISSVTDKINLNHVKILYSLFAANTINGSDYTMSIHQMISYIADDLIKDDVFESLIDAKTKDTIIKAKNEISNISSSLVGDNYSILMLDTIYPEESKETSEFINSLHKDLIDNCNKEYYMIGNSPMNVELENGFKKDLVLITALSVIAIFIVVALTFRSFIIPLILVLIVQCGVYFTVLISGLMGRSIYYLALLVVQCILMGATIDYGIVFTNYYLEYRKSSEPKEALKSSFKDSIHTILTSSLIIIIITGVIGICPADPAITEICQTLSIGTACVLLLILFVLPGLLACLDKIVSKSNKNRKDKSEN